MGKKNTFLNKNLTWLKFLNLNLLLLIILLLITNHLGIVDLQVLISIKKLTLSFICLFFTFLHLQYQSLTVKKERTLVLFFEYLLVFCILSLFFSTLDLSFLGNLVREYYLFFYLIFSFSLLSILKKGKEDEKKITSKKNTYIFIISLLIIIAFFIRYMNLTSTDPHIDEYNHLVGARSILTTGETSYTRSYFLTYLISVLQSLSNSNSFFEYLYWARIPGIIVGSLSIIPIYLLLDRKYKVVGIISSILWVTSPWAIIISRTVRGYIFYLPVILTCLLLLFYTLKKLLNYKKEYLFKIILSILFILLSIYYALFIDRYSTMKLILPILCLGYFSFIVVNIKTILEKFKHRKIILSIIVLLHLGVSLFILSYLNRNPDINFLSISPNFRWLEYFFDFSYLHWWSDFNHKYIVILCITTGFIFALKEKNKNYFLCFLIFFLTLFSYVFFFKRYMNHRYIFYILPFFIILIAYGIYYLFKIKGYISNKILRYIYIFSLVLFILLSFKIPNNIKPTIDKNSGYLNDIFVYLEDKVEKEDTIISYINHAFWLEFELDPCNTYKYRYPDIEMPTKAQNIIEENNQGYLIITSHIKNWRSLYPTRRFFYIGETFVETLKIEDQYIIYRWNKE